jgi:peptidyl-tRNA hydrolase, PTH1 family
MHLIYGLGNQDPTLLNTKHNLGRLVVEKLAQELGLSFKNDNGLAVCKTNGVILAYSLGYMNNSGQNLQQFLNFYKPNKLKLWLLQDDSDQIEGYFKDVYGGGSGGHNGIISVYKYLLNWPINQKEVLRIKLGIRQENNKQKALDFVLKPISKSDLELTNLTANRLQKLIDNYPTN